MILSGKLNRRDIAGEKALCIGEAPVAEYLQQLSGKAVHLHIAAASKQFAPDEADEQEFLFKTDGRLEARFFDQDDVGVAVVPEYAQINDNDIIELLDDTYSELGDKNFVMLLCDTETTSFEEATGGRVAPVQVTDTAEPDPVLARLVYHLVKKTPVLYQDAEYLVYGGAGIVLEYYRFGGFDGRKIEMLGDVVPRDLVDRLVKWGAGILTCSSPDGSFTLSDGGTL